MSATIAIPSNRTTEFWKMMKKELNSETYDNLEYITRLPARRLRFLRMPAHGVGTMKVEEIELFAKILNVGVDELIQKYGCGSNCLTIDDVNRVVHPMGYEVGFVAHVA